MTDKTVNDGTLET